MSKIVGIRKTAFNGSDGTLVTGYHVHLSTPFFSGAKNPGIGEQVERVFVSERKLEDALMCYGSPAALVGMDCEPVYNRFGKIAAFTFPGEM